MRAPSSVLYLAFHPPHPSGRVFWGGRRACSRTCSRRSTTRSSRHRPFFSSNEARQERARAVSTDEKLADIRQGQGSNGRDARKEDWNPLGPPGAIASLAIGETHSIPLLSPEKCPEEEATRPRPPLSPLSITRLSRNPDIFLVRSFLPSRERRESLIEAAEAKGLKVAGTKRSEENSVRKGSYLAWLDPADDDEGGTMSMASTGQRGVASTLQGMTDLAGTLFVHESLLNPVMPAGERPGRYCTPEDVQVAKYDVGGSYDLHHDGNGRFLTVLTYLNGVGGTYFPLARTRESSDVDDTKVPVIKMDEDDAWSSEGVPGRDGLLIVGEEFDDDDDCSSKPSGPPRRKMTPGAVVRIRPGDAIAFYSYYSGQNLPNEGGGDSYRYQEDHSIEWRTLHASLATPREKWIATNWFRSDNLTGPFALLYKDRILEMGT